MTKAQAEAPDLTRNPPRSPRVRLGGYVLLARVLDKGRALLAGKNGEYNFDCPMDKYFLDFVGLKGSDIKSQLEQGKSDGEILVWIQENAPRKHERHEILAWSRYHEERGPTDAESQQFFTGLLIKCGPKRSDVSTWFELLDLDDYVTFGGRA
jgi:hypothetical protein